MNENRQNIRDRLLALDTTTVSDVLEQVGLRDQALSTTLLPLDRAQAKLAGFAYTVRGQMMPYEGPGDPDKMTAIDGMHPGVVSVWAGDAEGMACFGELLALAMKVRGCLGAVVSGGVRDADRIARHGMPVYAKYRSPVQSIGRWKVTACEVPVIMPGATARRVEVRPGDFLLGDGDGVVVIPAAHIGFVLDEAEKITTRETRIRNEIRDGATLDVVLGRYGRT